MILSENCANGSTAAPSWRPRAASLFRVPKYADAAHQIPCSDPRNSLFQETGNLSLAGSLVRRFSAENRTPQLGCPIKKWPDSSAKTPEKLRNREKLGIWRAQGQTVVLPGHAETGVLNCPRMAAFAGLARPRYDGCGSQTPRLGVSSEGLRRFGAEFQGCVAERSVLCEPVSTWRAFGKEQCSQTASDCHSAKAAERRILKV